MTEDITVKELSEKKFELESAINELLRQFTRDTGYCVTDLIMDFSLAERYNYEPLRVPQYSTSTTINISTFVPDKVRKLM